DIATYYQFIHETDEYFKYKGIEYYLNKQFPNDYHFNIFDLGILNIGSLQIFKSCDIKILCSGSKPYEMLYLNKALQLMNNDCINT
ncbi:hypothetical protein, partial [Salmonella sp. SAL4435]|uniref:hypothetical protein n=1 Tax=Salmonella sp. SAL4435 TaxID=3159890 RepID=UPI003979DA41